MVVFLKLVLLQTVLAAHIARGRPIAKAPQNTHQEDMDVVNYLVQDGYLSSNETGPGDISTAVEKFQQGAGLNVTVELDDSNVQKIHAERRCGMKDIEYGTPRTRAKRSSALNVGYVLEGSKWEKKGLTYSFRNCPSSMKNSHKVVKRALKTPSKRGQTCRD